MLRTEVEIKSSKRYQNSNDKSREIIKSRHAKDMFHLKIALSTHTSHNGDLARMNFRLKNDNTIDLDYPCALQNTLVFGL